MERLMFGWDFEVDAWSRFWRWNLIKICVWTCDKNSTLGSVVPLAMFDFDTFPQLFSFFYQSTALPFVWTLGASITASKFNWRMPEHSNRKDNRAFTFHKIIGGFQTSNNSAILTRQSGGICHQLQIIWSGRIFYQLGQFSAIWWDFSPLSGIAN